jgi:trans-aconitate methyltransferase
MILQSAGGSKKMTRSEWGKHCRDPVLWDTGCANDEIRNRFVIPFLSSVLREFRPSTVADVGCGSGYIIRALAAQEWAAAVHWRLIDRSQRMLDYASTRMPASAQHTAIAADLLLDIGTDSLPISSAVVSTFTLLEFPLNENIVDRLARLIQPSGILIVVLPDVLQDVMSTSTQEAAIKEYCAGHIALAKIDKFLGETIPFHANRFERIVEYFSCVFDLITLCSTVNSNGNRYYGIVWRSRT